MHGTALVEWETGTEQAEKHVRELNVRRNGWRQSWNHLLAAFEPPADAAVLKILSWL